MSTILLVFFIFVLVVWLLFSMYRASLYKRMFNACLCASVSVGTKIINKDWAVLADNKSGDANTEMLWLKLVHKLFIMFQKKHNNYGIKNLTTSGIPGIIIRLGDKISRLWTLVLGGNSDAVQESVTDTFMDIANYAVMGALFSTGALKRTDVGNNIGVGAQRSLIFDLLKNLNEVDRLDILSEIVGVYYGKQSDDVERAGVDQSA